MTRFEAPTKALIIASPHIERILAGEKTWEMRSRNCTIRGLIGLIRKGSGTVVGLVDIIGVRGPLTRDELLANLDKHRATREQVDDPALAKWNLAWVLDKAHPLPHPIPYLHPKGAQSWIKLDDKARHAILQQMTL